MKKFMALYCFYDPDNYVGHRVKHISADSIEEAEQILFSDLNKRIGRGRIEYSIHEVLPGAIQYRIYNNDTQTRE